jgi:cell wall-associated NlpC family hydrolase
MLPSGAPVLAPAATRSSRGEPAAKAAAALSEDLLRGAGGYPDPLGPSLHPGKSSAGLPAVIARGSRRVLPVARRLRAPARIVLVAAVLVITSLGLTRPTAARAAVAARASGKRLELSAWRYALRQDGKPYVWGGTGPYGFDCSGLVYASYRSEGLRLPRTSYGMLSSRHLIRIRKSQARRGDVAFFGPGHVEIYDRGNWTFGAADAGTRIGFHHMNRFWHPTMYFRVSRQTR